MPPGDARHPYGLNIFWDVDGTLITWDYKLRPHVHDVFEQLVVDGHRVYIWSGMGLRYEIVEGYNLTPLVAGVFRKPLYDFTGRLHEFTPIRPDFVIDDYREIVDALGGFQIRPPVPPMIGDDQMWAAYDAFSRHVQDRLNGHGV